MDLSVVIVTRNTAALTEACLASLSEGCAPLSHEAIVVDNGSADGTIAHLRARFPDVRLIENGANLGFARAANQGWRAASGETILFCNSDARLSAGAAARLAAFLRETPRAGLAGARLLHADGSFQNSVDAVPDLATELTSKPLLKRLWPARFGLAGSQDAPSEVPTLVGACFAARRECLSALGGFDERFFLFMEETDLCVRARAAGWTVWLVPASRATHLQGQTARRDAVASQIEYFRSRYAFFRKHRGRVVTAALATGLLARLLVEATLQGAACGVTAFQLARLRRRWAVTMGVLLWHLSGCPAGGGLPR